MHATVDFHRKNLKISPPDEWSMVLQTARREMEQHEVFDSHALSKSFRATNLKTGIQWMKVKCVRVKKGVTDAVDVKHSYSDEYQEVSIRTDGPNCKTRKRSVGTAAPELNESLLIQAYKQPLPVSVAKKADLLKLCATRAIKSKYHTFYNLTTSISVPDCLPQPDYSESLECDVEK